MMRRWSVSPMANGRPLVALYDRWDSGPAVVLLQRVESPGSSGVGVGRGDGAAGADFWRRPVFGFYCRSQTRLAGISGPEPARPVVTSGLTGPTPNHSER